MMLDVTGSMAGQKLQDLKDAAKDLIDIVVWEDQSKFTSKVALVPFSEDVRLPTTSALNKARGTGLAATKTRHHRLGSATSRRRPTICPTASWSAPVAEVHGRRAEVGPIRDGPLHRLHAESGNGNRRRASARSRQARRSCRLTSDETTLKQQDRRPLGLGRHGRSSRHGLGLVHAVAQLDVAVVDGRASPRPTARDNLQEDRHPDDRRRVQHAVRFERRLGRLVEMPGSAANGSSTTQARALCTAMKAKGITVYTVGFELGGNQTAIDTLNQCATDSDQVLQRDDGDQLSRPSATSRSSCRRSICRSSGRARSSGAQASSMQSSSKPASTSAMRACRASGPCGPCAVQVQRRSRSRRQHHQAHDRGAADRLAVARHRDGRVEALGALDELRRGARVQALAIADGDDRLGPQAVPDLRHGSTLNFRPTALGSRP